MNVSDSKTSEIIQMYSRQERSGHKDVLLFLQQYNWSLTGLLVMYSYSTVSKLNKYKTPI